MSRFWHVVLESGSKLDIGPWKANMQWGGNVFADNEDDAIAAAREQCRPAMGDDYADGRVHSVIELFQWHVTVRGRHDKRRRETFTVWGENETVAIRNAFYLPAVTSFAGYRSKRKDPVVKVVRA